MSWGDTNGERVWGLMWVQETADTRVLMREQRTFKKENYSTSGTQQEGQCY